jgi:hypothetical protein
MKKIKRSFFSFLYTLIITLTLVFIFYQICYKTELKNNKPTSFETENFKEKLRKKGYSNFDIWQLQE